ncbi:MAG: crossover junction endodeoxyribonuclease RuvC [Lachnospiraceae bacterium]|nr:crossover junction endodeoxyribonuclease RuvC [Ruminococcus sp.]MCM1275077.1 crossover junction endodeoxyribonuclease RuvC [Lachnospiraceae bacterium]
MRILGIDPGYAIVGYGVLEFNNTRFKVINYGAVTTDPETPFDRRLAEIYGDMCSVLDMFKPDCMSIEKLYFNTNITTGIDVAQARGVIMLAAVQKGVPIFEYTPLQVKVAVTGYGRAEKRQVQEMTKNILRLKEIPKPDDTADALAIAICHGHTGGSKMSEIMRANEVRQLNKK